MRQKIFFSSLFFLLSSVIYSQTDTAYVTTETDHGGSGSVYRITSLSTTPISSPALVAPNQYSRIALADSDTAYLTTGYGGAGLYRISSLSSSPVLSSKLETGIFTAIALLDQNTGYVGDIVEHPETSMRFRRITSLSSDSPVLSAPLLTFPNSATNQLFI